MPASNMGYPDGDNQPSVTLDYRRTYTITPVNGQIIFALAPSAQGCLNILTGNAASSIITVTPASATGFSETIIGAGVSGYVGQIPEAFLATALNSTTLAGAGNTAPSYRPLVCTADVIYTGSTMMDNGSVVISKLRNSERIDGTQLVDALNDYSMERAQFDGVAAASLLPSSEVHPARQAFNVRVVPVRPLYEPVYESVTDASFPNHRNFAFRSNVATGPMLAPSYHPQCPWKLVYYSGLDASASITVSYRYCVQYAINPSSTVAPLAQPSPVESPGAITRAIEYVSKLPVATRIANSLLGGAYNLALSYLAPRAGLQALLPH